MNIIKLTDGMVIQKLNDAVEKTTGRKMVVYQEMEAPYTVYVVEESAFFGMISGNAPADRSESEASMPKGQFIPLNTVDVVPKEDHTNLMMGFLDAQTYKEKIKFLEKERSSLTPEVLELMAAGMDENIEGDDTESMYYSLIQVLRTKARFEVER